MYASAFITILLLLLFILFLHIFIYSFLVTGVLIKFSIQCTASEIHDCDLANDGS